MQKRLKGIIVLMATAGGAGILATFMLMWMPALAADAAGSAGPAVPEGALQWGFLAAALATGLSSLGAGIAVAGVGPRTALGVLSGLTAGLLAIFYVGPYMATAFGGYYTELKKKALEDGVVTLADFGVAEEA